MPCTTTLKSGSGSKIKFQKNELIENCLETGNIELSLTISKCKVINALENESVKKKSLTNENSPMVFICRYKLVKETTYKLVPIDNTAGRNSLNENAQVFFIIFQCNVYLFIH